PVELQQERVMISETLESLVAELELRVRPRAVLPAAALPARTLGAAENAGHDGVRGRHVVIADDGPHVAEVQAPLPGSDRVVIERVAQDVQIVPRIRTDRLLDLGALARELQRPVGPEGAAIRELPPNVQVRRVYRAADIEIDSGSSVRDIEAVARGTEADRSATG